ncbi:hypothetical protein DXA36_20060 [Eisenbergiella sp. OF01-20]|nr:hypothetical protein DXA36_20060 [Eisenbergiella sp. OF01-20]
MYKRFLRTENETVGEKIGIRTIEVSDGCIRLNGTAVKFKGVIRHGSVEASHTIDNKGDYSGIALFANNELFEKTILDRIQMMVIRDRNRTSVLIWSMGNESGYSKAFEKVARWIRAENPSRLVHYQSMHELEGAPKAVDSEETLDMVFVMYPAPAWIEKDFWKRKTRNGRLSFANTAMLGNGSGDLEDYWNFFI